MLGVLHLEIGFITCEFRFNQTLIQILTSSKIQKIKKHVCYIITDELQWNNLEMSANEKKIFV